MPMRREADPPVVRHLTEREIFGEPRRRQLLGGTRQQREKRPPRWMRPPCAAVEPCRHAGAPQRVLEQAEVALRRANEDRHLVEPDAARACRSTRRAISTHSRPSPGAEKNSSDPSRARRGGRGGRVEEKSSKTARSSVPLPDRSSIAAPIAGEMCDCVAIAVWDRRNRPPTRAAPAPRRARARRHPPARCRAARPATVRVPLLRSSLAATRNSSDRSTDAAFAKPASNRSSSHARSGPAGPKGEQTRPADAGQAQLLQRSRQRPWKAGRRRDRRKVRQRPLLHGVERRARRDRFGPEPRARRRPMRPQAPSSAVRAASCVEAEALYPEGCGNAMRRCRARDRLRRRGTRRRSGRDCPPDARARRHAHAPAVQQRR